MAGAAAATAKSSASKTVFNFASRCTCGKVEAAIETLEKAPPIRLVCYCSDCRGYYESLDRLALENGSAPSGILDNWGGVDWTALYPRDIHITKGKEYLKTTVIRPTSTIRQVYASCCHTPMFRFGDMSVLMNSNLIPPEEKAKLPIEFRVVGRNAWKEGSSNGKNNKNHNKQKEQPQEQPITRTTSSDEAATTNVLNNKKPPMSWSVPFCWFWVMPSRVRTDLMQPMPFEVPTVNDVKAGKVDVLEHFQPGSK